MEQMHSHELKCTFIHGGGLSGLVSDQGALGSGNIHDTGHKEF